MTTNGKERDAIYGIGNSDLYDGRSFQSCINYGIENQIVKNNGTEEARLSSRDFTACVKANIGIPQRIDSLLMQTVSNADIYINKNSAVLEYCKIVDSKQQGQPNSIGKSWFDTSKNKDYSYMIIQNSDTKETVECSNVSNVLGFTVGDINTGPNCTTVHSVQKCQVSARFYNNRILDHAAIYTNMRSEGEPFDYCDFTCIQHESVPYESKYYCTIENTNKIMVLQEQGPHIDSICSASYIKQANDEWEESIESKGQSYSYIKAIEHMLGEYCDLGIQPHNTNSQEFAVSLSNIIISNDNEYFSSVFSQDGNTQSFVEDYNKRNNTLSQPEGFKNGATTQYKALVPYQAKYGQREFGFIPYNLPEFQMMPIAT